MLVKVQPITHHKGVGDGEAHVIGLEGQYPALRLIQQGADLEGGRAALLQLRQEKSQLEIQQKRLYTPAYLAETAEKLGMVRPQPEDFFILHIRGAQTP